MIRTFKTVFALLPLLTLTQCTQKSSVLGSITNSGTNASSSTGPIVNPTPGPNPTANPTPGSTPVPTPKPSSTPLPPPTPTPGPTPVGSAYPGFTYTLPTVRPYISLKDFDGVSKTSAAYTTLKNYVDIAVTATANLPAGSTYDQLVGKLDYAYTCVDSIVMYRLTNDSKYIQQAIKMVDLFVQSENARIASGTYPIIAGDSYLEVGLYLEQLSLTYDYGYALLSATQRTQWAALADQAISNVWNYNTASWGGKPLPWSGWSVNDPGDNYYYSFLKATQLWSLASQNMTWIKFLQQQKYTQLVPYFSVLTGGGSREGTGYGTALGSLFEDYRYWKSSTTEDLSALTPHAKDTIDYWIHATTPNFNYFASIGDQSRSSMTAMFDYQRKLMIEDVNLNIGSAQASRGAWWLNRIGVADGGGGWVYGKMRYNFDYRYDLLSSTVAEQAPTALVYHATGGGALFARSAWNTAASWFATVAGPYDQSHAHQDQGSFQFFKGSWLSVTSNTLSNSGLQQGTSAHNVIRFMSAGSVIPQNNSVSSMSYSDSADVLTVHQVLTPAYSSHSSQVSSWTRDYTYTRSTNTLQIHDLCTVGSGVTPVFQIHVPVAATVSGSNVTAGNLKVTQTLPAVTGSNAPKVVSMPTTDSDYQGGYRIELTGPGCEFQVTLQGL